MSVPEYSEGVGFVRGQYVPISDASIPITDWGFLRSDATYDVVTVWEGSFFRLDALLDDSLILADRMNAQGSTVALKVFPGMWHVWQMLGGRMPEADQSVQELGSFLGAHLVAQPA